MKKRFIVAGFAAVMFFAVSAQITEKEDPPKPPTAPVEKAKDIPPPPPPPPPISNEPALPPAPPKPPLPPAEGVEMHDDYNAFLKRNPLVKSLGWTMKQEVIVRLKSGKEERFKLDDARSMKAAEIKYGKFPIAPPPPPPPSLEQ